MKIGVIGTGAYGMALAKVLYTNGHNITMWTKFEEEKELLVKNHGNDALLKDVYLPDDIKITCNLDEVCQEKDIVVIALPVAYLEDVLKEMANYSSLNICIATKGISRDGRLVSKMVNQYLENSKLAVLSGPTFAIDLANESIAGLTVASSDDTYCDFVSSLFENNKVNMEKSNDIIGVQLCGSIKNIIAVGTGILTGLDQKITTTAFFQTKCLKDLANIITKLGGNSDSVFTYAGIGDILLTCNSVKSRNYTYGIKVGSKASDLLEYEKNTTIEGLYTMQSLKNLLAVKNIDFELNNVLCSICVDKLDSELLLEYLTKEKEMED